VSFENHQQQQQQHSTTSPCQTLALPQALYPQHTTDINKPFTAETKVEKQK
jgi:hypothetical protein